MKPGDFIMAIAPAARESMLKTRIPASFVIAQAALESGWGSHAPGMNLFGVKADKSWHGATITLPTREFIKGKWVVVSAIWRKYNDWLECIDDHAQFFLTNHRYQYAFIGLLTGEQFAKSIAAAGYATDPKYADKLIAVMRSHDLSQYDEVTA